MIYGTCICYGHHRCNLGRFWCAQGARGDAEADAAVALRDQRIARAANQRAVVLAEPLGPSGEETHRFGPHQFGKQVKLVAR